MEIPYFLPKSFDELDDFLQQIDKDVTYVAGATDIMIHPKMWRAAECLMSMTSVTEAHEAIQPDEKGVLIGASVPLSGLTENNYIQKHFPILVEACRQIGSVQIQNRATLGGNIANASPAGDTLPVLSVLDALLSIGPRKNRQFREVKLDDVMLGPGKTSLRDNSYIAYIYLPLPDPVNLFTYFRKVGQRHSMAISKLSLAVLGWIKDNRFFDIRISAGSVSPQVKRAQKTEKILINHKLTATLMEEAADQLSREISPITDIRSTASYRSKICQSLLKEALQLAGNRKQKVERRNKK